VLVEGIITQLIFDHALRVRMKAEVADGPATPGASVATTPDTASIAETSNTADESGDETLGASQATGSSATAATVAGGPAVAGKVAASTAEPEKSYADGSSKADNLVGKINNLVTTDLGNLVDGRDFLFIVLYAPLEFGLAVYFLYAFLGWSAFVGLAVMLILFPIPGYLAKKIQDVQVQRMKKTDARVQTVTETMSVLRMIKLFGWEKKINVQLEDKREEELKLVWKRKILDMINNNINYVLPLTHMVATYLTFTVIMKQPLSASLVFSTMSVFDVLRGQLFMILQGTPMFIQAKVSLDRVDDFLHDTELLDEFARVDKDETDQVEIADPAPVPTDALGFHATTFTWSATAGVALTPSRRNFKLRIEDEVIFKRGGFNLIVGPTGSGKTSLLMALLGEMHFEPHSPNSWFHLPRNGGVAYAAQESWVQNETIKDNIVFGAPFDEARYKKGK
jgi:ABC-type multidrug transport system fused ATPase/permease subunit